MGWSFSCVDTGRKAHIERITSQKHFSEDYRPLASRVVGNNVWQVVLHIPTGRRFITLDLIAKERGGGWGYKGLSEDMGPNEVNCPLSLLALAGPPKEGHAAAWREKVRAYHANKKTKPKYAAGMVVKYSGALYTLDGPAPGARRGWNVTSQHGARYRMSFKQLADAEVIHAPV